MIGIFYINSAHTDKRKRRDDLKDSNVMIIYKILYNIEAYPFSTWV